MIIIAGILDYGWLPEPILDFSSTVMIVSTISRKMHLQFNSFVEAIELGAVTEHKSEESFLGNPMPMASWNETSSHKGEIVAINIQVS